MLREGLRKTIWKFKMEFSIKRRTLPQMDIISIHFLPPFFSSAIEYYLYETDSALGTKYDLIIPLYFSLKLSLRDVALYQFSFFNIVKNAFDPLQFFLHVIEPPPPFEQS